MHARPQAVRHCVKKDINAVLRTDVLFDGRPISSQLSANEGFNVFGHYEIVIRCHITVPKVPYTALILMEKVTNYVDDMYVLFS